MKNKIKRYDDVLGNIKKMKQRLTCSRLKLIIIFFSYSHYNAYTVLILYRIQKLGIINFV